MNDNQEITDSIKTKTVPFYKNAYFLTVLFVILSIVIFSIKFTFVMVAGNSMEPTYYNGNILFAEKNTELSRFNTVIIYTKDNNFIIKRVIGLPGETVEYQDNNLYINGKKIKDNYGNGTTNNFSVVLDKNSYFCLGDNRENSKDSRYFGAFNKNEIFAKVIK